MTCQRLQLRVLSFCALVLTSAATSDDLKTVDVKKLAALKQGTGDFCCLLNAVHNRAHFLNLITFTVCYGVWLCSHVFTLKTDPFVLNGMCYIHSVLYLLYFLTNKLININIDIAHEM